MIKNQKGFAMVLSLVLLLAMSLMGGALILIASGDHQGNNDSDQYQQTFYAAEMGLLDGEQYILNEKIALPSLYFSHKRQVVNRDGVLLAKCDYITLNKNEKWEELEIRCRTIGDMTCTGVTKSKANSLEDIIEEVASTRVTERGGRADDKRSEAAMEDRKKEGYF